MTSAINTGTINVNYPTPGVNNSSQGMRDNFAGTKDNLDIAADELSQLQAKSLLKSALPGTVLDNDMNNGIIKNVQTLGFRSSTYNLGTNSGTINIDLTLGDVQYGVLNGNSVLTFSKWPPAGTQSRVQVVFTVTPGQTITLPYALSGSTPTGVIYGKESVEGLTGNTITVPADVTYLHYEFVSQDCGTSIEIIPVNRPRQSTQVKSGTPWSARIGTISTVVGNATVTGTGTLFTTELSVGQVITDANNTIIGTVSAIASNTSLTLASTATVAYTNVAYRVQKSTGAQGDVAGDVKVDSSYLYVCSASYDGTTAIWKRISLTAY